MRVLGERLQEANVSRVLIQITDMSSIETPSSIHMFAARPSDLISCRPSSTVYS